RVLVEALALARLLDEPLDSGPLGVGRRLAPLRLLEVERGRPRPGRFGFILVLFAPRHLPALARPAGAPQGYPLDVSELVLHGDAGLHWHLPTKLNSKHASYPFRGEAAYSGR